jgi:hypothetical protein
MTPVTPPLRPLFDALLSCLSGRGITLSSLLQAKLAAIIEPFTPPTWEQVKAHFACVCNPLGYLERHPEDQIRQHLWLLSKLDSQTSVLVEVRAEQTHSFWLSIAGLDRQGALTCLLPHVFSGQVRIDDFEVATYEIKPGDAGRCWEGQEPRYFLDLRCAGQPQPVKSALSAWLFQCYPPAGSEHRTTSWGTWEWKGRSFGRARFDLEEVPDAVSRVVKMIQQKPDLTVAIISAAVRSTRVPTATALSALTGSRATSYGEAVWSAPCQGGREQQARTGQGGTPPMNLERQQLLDQSVALFEEQFPDLMRTHRDDWVAYSGRTCLGFSGTKLDLLKRCYELGYTDDRLFVAKIQPDVGEQYATWELWGED